MKMPMIPLHLTDRAIRRPMLAETLVDPSEIRFPVLATPKIDGFRCLTLPVSGGSIRAVSRSFKPIKNDYIRECIERLGIAGLDGELVTLNERGERNPFHVVSSEVSKKSGQPNFRFLVFDYFDGQQRPYKERVEALDKACLYSSLSSQVSPLLPVEIACEESFRQFEEQCIEAGYEGVMLRNPHGGYKFGRSANLLKVKRWEDEEAEVIGFDELMHNGSEATTDAHGLSARSSHKANKIGLGILGSIRLRNERGEFSVGSGFSTAQREEYWSDRHSLLGRLVKFKFQPAGAKDKPRFPIFLGFRDEDDLAKGGSLK